MRPILLALLLMIAPAARAEDAFRPGVFALEGMREAASQLELSADGRFRFWFSYGALDEAGEGRWRRDGAKLVLDTEPAYRPAEFVLVGARKAPAAPLLVIVNGPDGVPMRWPIDVDVTLSSGEVIEGDTRATGFELPIEPDAPPVSLRLSLAVAGVSSEPFAVDIGSANLLTFAFVPNSLGQPPFVGQPMLIEGDDLVMPRGDAMLRYRRVR